MPGMAALIIGKRCSGKSILLYDIMSRISWTNFGLALTPTQSSKAKFAASMPDLMIDKQSPERLEQFVKTINTLYDKATTQGKQTKASYLLCDDTAFDDKFMRSKSLSEIFLNGRNFGCTCVLVLQYLMKVGPELRSNADFVFIFWDNNRKNMDRLWEFWFSQLPKKTFFEVFAECTRDYGVLVIDVRKSATSRDWHDCVFWYKARKPEDIEPFSMCDRDFYRMTDYCKLADSDERRFKEASANERVWRLGPDGQLFDAPTWVQSKVDGCQSDSDEALEVEECEEGM